LINSLSVTVNDLSLAQRIARLSPEDRARALEGIDRDALLWDWRFWGRPPQFAPSGNPRTEDGSWKTWLAMAGRGFGKTRLGAEWIRGVACGETPEAPGSATRIALIGETARDVRKVMVEGDSGILAVHPPAFRPEWQPSTRTLMWPNGCIAATYNATEPDELRGPQFDAAWCDELAKWAYATETWDQLQFGLRLGDDPRQLVTTTPRPIPIIRQILDDPTTVVTRGSTLANKGNLAPSFLTHVTGRYAGTRLGRQELEGELIEDIEGALWSRKMLEAARVREAPPLHRIVIAVDPSGTSGGSGGDDIGIIVAGVCEKGHGYVLADHSCNLSPAGWAERVVSAYHAFNADRVIAEVNYGGAMVEAVIRGADPAIPFRGVTASKGKVARAEPIAALYEQGRVHHVNAFPDLEDELCGLIIGGSYEGPGRSPDRADALVWAFTDLMTRGQAAPSIRNL
jgi:phage terminase large subunit-like protein